MAEDIKIDEVQQVKDAAYITVVLASRFGRTNKNKYGYSY